MAKNVFSKEELMEKMVNITNLEQQYYMLYDQLAILNHEIGVGKRAKVSDYYNFFRQIGRKYKTPREANLVYAELLEKSPFTAENYLRRFCFGVYSDEDKQRFKIFQPIAFNTIKNNADLIYSLFELRYTNTELNFTTFTSKQIQEIYNLHGDYLLDKSKNGVYEMTKYCLLFIDQITNVERSMFAKLLTRLKSETKIQEIIKNPKFKFTEEMLERAEGKLVYKKLSR